MQVCESVQYKCEWDGSKGRMEGGGWREGGREGGLR